MLPMDLTTLVSAARISGSTSLGVAGVKLIINPVTLTSGVINRIFARPMKPGGGVPSVVPNTPSSSSGEVMEEESCVGIREEVSVGDRRGRECGDTAYAFYDCGLHAGEVV